VRNTLSWLSLHNVYKRVRTTKVIFALQVILFVGVLLKFGIDKVNFCTTENTFICGFMRWFFVQNIASFEFPIEIGIRILAPCLLLLGFMWYKVRSPNIIKLNNFSTLLPKISQNNYTQKEFNPLVSDLTELHHSKNGNKKFRFKNFSSIQTFINENVLFDKKVEIYILSLVTFFAFIIPVLLTLRRLITWASILV